MRQRIVNALPAPQARPEAPDAHLGQMIRGTYRVDRLIAKGGMGAVYEAFHVRMHRPVAIKLLLERLARSPEFVRRFRRETEIVALAHHPHIVQVLDVGDTEDGEPFFVMEYLEGETLRARLRRHGRLPLEDALRITSSVASALAQVHGVGIVHCDLTPANAFLVHQEREPDFLKLMDFGASTAPGSSSGFLSPESVLGTLNYMSPEQALGLDHLDHRADQFALATVTYEMLSGRKAFAGGSPSDVLGRIIEQEPAPLSSVAPWVPPVFDAILSRAMAKRRNRRFPDISQFASALENGAMTGGVALDGKRFPRVVPGARKRSARDAQVRAGSY